MIGMARYPDKWFDLALIDPPYGGGQHFNFRFGTGDQVYENHKPDPEYWKEVFRVSKDQIAWGGNYFADDLPVSRCWISWFKGNPLPNFSDFELAWTSFDKVCRQISIESYGFNHADKRLGGEKTIHPTQKPIALYDWIYKNYLPQGGKVVDTHLGSGSNRIAANKAGNIDFTGFELDKDYYEAQEKRWRGFINQTRLF